MVEGVLVTGTAVVSLSGECVRCLVGISDELEIDVQELFTYSESDASEDEASRMEGELIDLEPVLRDQVVLDLPFQPVCKADCAGLCSICGANLNDEPDHTHGDELDPRWAALAGLRSGTDESPGSESRYPSVIEEGSRDDDRRG